MHKLHGHIHGRRFLDSYSPIIGLCCFSPEPYRNYEKVPNRNHPKPTHRTQGLPRNPHPSYTTYSVMAGKDVSISPSFPFPTNPFFVHLHFFAFLLLKKPHSPDPALLPSERPLLGWPPCSGEEEEREVPGELFVTCWPHIRVELNPSLGHPKDSRISRSRI